MHIFVAGREALLDVSSILLTVKDGNDIEGVYDLEAKVP
jgi:hypothetical protein